MNVSEGDRAVIVFSVNRKNVGRIVNVAPYIGRFAQKEQLDFPGMPCEAPVTDHYWWIEADDIEIAIGPSPRAYIADSWLRKLVDPDKKVSTKQQKELDTII